MTFSLDTTSISIPCPQCGKKLKATLGRLKREKKITCPSCGPVTVNTDQLVSAERAIDKEIGKLKKNLSIKLKF